jgi:DNA-binding CsgD family transcriptional regulator
MTSLQPTLEIPRRLHDVVSADGYAQQAIAIIQDVATAPDQGAALALLERAQRALGAEHAVFVSFIRDDDSSESFRFMLACDPVWCMAYQTQGWYANDPWLLYAANNTEPICTSKIPLRTKAQRDCQGLAALHGFASAYVVPAPSGGGLSRLGVLVLGSGQAGYFEADAISALKVLARSLAMELHEWWVRQARKEIIARNRITPDDLALLECERRGLGTKEIAERLGISPSSVDSRFQRLNAKFNTPNRRAAARFAAEYGLI